MGILAMLNHLANWRRLVVLVLVNLQDKIINLLGVSSSILLPPPKNLLFALSMQIEKTLNQHETELVVSTHLKNMFVKLGSSSPILGGEISKICELPPTLKWHVQQYSQQFPQAELASDRPSSGFNWAWDLLCLTQATRTSKWWTKWWTQMFAPKLPEVVQKTYQ